MTIERFRRRRYVGAVTTGAVSLATAAIVGWAAAHPAHVSATTSPATASGPNPQAVRRTVQEIDDARSQLERVRHGLPRLIGDEDHLPRAASVNLPTVPSGGSTAVNVPAAPAAAPAPAPAPPVQATTGASGVVH